MHRSNSLIKVRDLCNTLKFSYWYGIPFVRVMMSVLKLNKINEIYDCYSHLKGQVFLNKVVDVAGIRYEFNRQWRERIPVKGPFIIIANHPLGAIEGTLLLQNLITLRPDVKILGNYLTSQIEPIRSFILAVNPLKTEQSSYSGLKNAWLHLREGGGLIIFPAGQVAAWQESEQKITDRAWSEPVIRFIKKAHVPVIPVYFDGYNSKLFYLLSYIHPSLRLAWIPREFLNKRKQIIRIYIGCAIKTDVQDLYDDIKPFGNYLRDSTFVLRNLMYPIDLQSIEEVGFNQNQNYKKIAITLNP